MPGSRESGQAAQAQQAESQQRVRPVAAWTWLDPAIVVGALGESGRAHALTSDPGGDLALALAIAGAGSVTHATSDLAAHALVELKLVAARELPVEGYRCLLGLDPAGRRVFYYHLIRAALSETCRAWWDAHEELIRLGVATCGVWERHLEGYRLRVMPLLRMSGATDALLETGEVEAARALVAERIDRSTWRAATRAWFSTPVLRGVGAPALPTGWLERLVQGIGETPPSRNFLLRFALTGTPGDLEAAWPQLTTWGHAALARASRRVHLVLAEPSEVLRAQPRGTFTGLAPGVVDGEDPLLALGVERLQEGGRIAAWIAGERPASLEGAVEDTQAERDLRRADRSAFCGPLLVARTLGRARAQA